MPENPVKKKAENALKHLAHIQVSEVMDLDFFTMKTGPERVEVSYDAATVIGRCPNNKEGRKE